MAKIKSMIKVKPKKYKIGDVVKVDFIVIHPMETGMKKNKKTGKIKPAHYINEVNFYYGDTLLSSMEVWESVSTNPYFSINMRVTKKAPLKVEFKDNKGLSMTKVKKIKPKG